MQHSKKQKLELQNRKSLKTILNLEPNLINFFLKQINKQNQRLISRSYINHYYLQTLRILTLIQVNYLVSSYIQLVKKADISEVSNIKIGIIGGGVFGRLLLNTLIVFCKQGISTKNISVSTRQPNHLQWYTDNFGIQVLYDNQNVAQKSDILFVTTPATLDNWIINDIKKVIDKKIEKINLSNKTSYRSTTTVRDLDVKPSSQSIPVISSKNSQSIMKKMKQSSQPFKNSVSILLQSNQEYSIKQCIQQHQISTTKKAKDYSTFQSQHLGQDQQIFIKQLDKFKISPKQVKPFHSKTKTKQIKYKSLSFGFQNQQTNSINKSSETQTQNVKNNSLNHDHFARIIQVFKYAAQKVDLKRKQQAFDNVRLSQKSKNNQNEQKISIVDQIFTTQGNQKSTFLARTRKWRMAYHNFIS